MKNYKIVVEYVGKNYSGWQIQDKKNTIEGNLTRAVKEISGEDATVFGSGRTDAGVSAAGQVANFCIEKNFEPQKLVLALNAHLPEDISVKSAEVVDLNFNARFSAKRKTYRYYFYVSPSRSAILDQFALQVKKANIQKMQAACKFLVGTKNFKSFVARNSGKTNFERTIFDAKIVQNGDLYFFEITGSGFLYNMVRIIMGTLIAVGEEKITPQHVETIIEQQDRTKAGKTVPPVGLVLYGVDYNA
ncbi:MAG: tRNA pseudouridine(38-40) synthase TruA [Clostridia bacterium]|nr:tRNA pseudouridine(38-40) synthase TruA [Clostridia bacterium]